MNHRNARRAWRDSRTYVEVRTISGDFTFLQLVLAEESDSPGHYNVAGSVLGDYCSNPFTGGHKSTLSDTNGTYTTYTLTICMHLITDGMHNLEKEID